MVLWACQALILLSSVSNVIAAVQFPVKVPWVSSDNESILPTKGPAANPRQPLRIAIVGAGAGGSSAAFWLHKAKERFGYDIEVDVYEQHDYIGGRSTVVYPHDNKSSTPIEIGGSIFVRENKIMMRAANEFNLTIAPSSIDLQGSDDGDRATGFGIWDGEKFVFTSGTGNGMFGDWWDNLKILWRYGIKAPLKTRKLTSTLIDAIYTLYPSSKTYETMEDMSAALNFTRLIAMSTTEYLDLEGVSKLYSREIVEAISRVSYGQNADQMHAMVGVVEMVSVNVFWIEGGNFLIFEKFLELSKANLHLKTTVSNIRKDSTFKTPKWTLDLTSSSDVTTQQTYNHVILAAPFPSTPAVEYVDLHVTIVTTTGSGPRSGYFNMKESETLPIDILTTNEGVRHGGKAPEFNSLTSLPGTYIGVEKDGSIVKERAFKIFSLDEKSDEWLENVFGEGNLRWVFRHQWRAFPYLRPITSYPPIKRDKGLWYSNAIEPFVSTMETSIVSARNVVEMLLMETFGSGMCNVTEDTTRNRLDVDANRIWGWDC